MTIYWTSGDCHGQAILTLHLPVGQVILFPYTGMDNLFVQPASRTLIACPGRTDGLCPSQVERNNDVPLFAVDARNT